uniref:hemagglutinin repeat-containing protein n=1 Tax=Photorhabdus antumapuensis TaxID=2862867 RepID=UPI001CED4A2B
MKTWEDERNIIEPASVVAAGNLVADFKDNIHIRTPLPYDINEMSQITVAGGYDTLSAENVVLNSGKISNNNIIKANNDITLLATDSVTLNTGEVISGGNVSMIAADNIDVLQSKIKGKNITVISRNADLKLQSNQTAGYFNHDGNRIISSIEATGDLLLNAGKNIILRDVFLTKSDNITLTANNDITIDNNNVALLSHKRIGSILSDIKEQELFNNLLSKVGKLDAKSSVVMNAGGNLSAKSIHFSAEKDINLTSAKSIDLTPRELSPSLSKFFPSSRSGELSSQLTAGNNISIISGTDINGKAVQIQANGNALLSSGRNITLLPLLYS